MVFIYVSTLHLSLSFTRHPRSSHVQKLKSLHHAPQFCVRHLLCNKCVWIYRTHRGMWIVLIDQCLSSQAWKLVTSSCPALNLKSIKNLVNVHICMNFFGHIIPASHGFFLMIALYVWRAWTWFPSWKKVIWLHKPYKLAKFEYLGVKNLLFPLGM